MVQMNITQREAESTVKPGSQYDAGNASVMSIESIAETNLYVLGQNAILNTPKSDNFILLVWT